MVTSRSEGGVVRSAPDEGRIAKLKELSGSSNDALFIANDECWRARF